MNKVFLLGRFVADPVIRYTTNNIPMARFRIAVNRPGKPQEGQPNADFFQITAWKGTAEFVNKYFRKGQQILIKGYLRNNVWNDQQGNKQYRGAPNAPSNSDPAGQPYSENSVYSLNEDDEDLPF